MAHEIMYLVLFLIMKDFLYSGTRGVDFLNPGDCYFGQKLIPLPVNA